MQQFVKNHQDAVLIVCALSIVGLLGGLFIWGMYDMSMSIADGLKVKQSSGAKIDVNIVGAENILSARKITR